MKIRTENVFFSDSQAKNKQPLDQSTDGLQIIDLHLKYPKSQTEVLTGVNLHVGGGEIVALLGTSGSGKSTILRAVAGLEKPTSGSITWDGKDLGAVPIHRRRFAMLFQDGQLFAHRNVGRNIAYPMQLFRPRLSRDEINSRVKKLLELVDLSGYEDRRIETLSGGQAGRVALARALGANPRLLLLDEPMAALDTNLRFNLAKEIRKGVKKTGAGAIYVTHDHQEARLVADRIAIIGRGKILQVGTWDELSYQPADDTVTEFLRKETDAHTG